MNILFDQTEAQALFYNGAAEYAQVVFFKMLSLLDKYPEVNVYSLYSSDRKFKYERLSYQNLAGIKNVTCVDYKGKTLKGIINEYNIDVLFVTCMQAFCDLPLGDLNNLPCKVVGVIHDLTDEELSRSHVFFMKHLDHPYAMMRAYLSKFKARLVTRNMSNRCVQMISMLNNNDADIITVSDYTRYSIKYNYPNLKNKIHVFYAPEKEAPVGNKDIQCKELRQLVEGKKRYFLIVSADRIMKNALSMTKAFNRFVNEQDSDYIIATIGRMPKLYKQHVALPSLSSSDLEQAYSNCHALLYPSLFEGFGYPPLEAMKYAKPVICSNVCSMPSVLEDAPIYFSPIYETDMYGALEKFDKMDYEELKARSLKQYQKVNQRQNVDLEQLVHKLLSGNFLN
ncbi:glycosyltransferase [uncultured Prevotella sp.]|uniref:glycosyltransferase n=1 Tax=uncultured Prevotella sp. TaxID=159272 RepID=UPI002637F88B|nr:glycosyltransferase [uncultured Prevotella sp.]